MNIFAWLFIAFTLSLLALLFFLTLVIGIDIHAAHKRGVPQSRHTSLSFIRAALEIWRPRRKRNPETIQPAVEVTGSARPREPNRESLTGAPPPDESVTRELQGDVTLICKLVTIKGQVFSREDIYLDGDIEGTVDVPKHRLTIGPEGRLRADVRARTIVVHGTVYGKVEVGEKMEIGRDARLFCEIKAGRVSVEDGAYLRGSIALEINRQAGVGVTVLSTGLPWQDTDAS
jgi:cytoskeletal protein CcmA (bactofilin family)